MFCDRRKTFNGNSINEMFFWRADFLFSVHRFIFTFMVSSGAHRVTTSINGKVDSGNEAGGIRCQEGDAMRHFLHLPWSAEGVRLLTPLKELVVKTEWALNKFNAIKAVVNELCLAEMLMNLLKWHWLDTLPVCTAAHPVLLFCEHLWW